MAIRKMVVVLLMSMSMTASSWGTALLAGSSRGDNVVYFYSMVGSGFIMPAGSVAVGNHPGEMCLSPDAKLLFVSNGGDKSISVIDVDGRKVVATLTTPGMLSPDGCAVSVDSKTLYSVDQESGALFVFSIESRQMLKKIPVGKEPRRAIVSPDGKRVLVSNAGSNTLSVIDTASDAVTGTIKTGIEPRDMAFSPDGKLLAVSVIEDDSMAIFDAATLEFKQQVGAVRSPQHVEFAPDSQHLYVLGKISDEVGVLRVGRTVRTEDVIPVEHGPLGTLGSWGMAMTPDGKYLFVSNLSGDTVSSIDLQTRKTIRAFPGGKYPVGLIYIRATSGVTTMGMPERMEHYRSLAEKAMAAVKAGDMAAASKLCSTLEQDWDEGEMGLRQSNPDAWGQVDEAMDAFIHPIVRSGGEKPDARALDEVYQDFLGKLKLVH